MKIRTFIAIDLPDDVREKIFKIEKRLMKIDTGVKWEAREKFHVTLKFLGDVNEEAVGSIEDVLKQALVNFPKFNVIYEGIGCFPDKRKPKIIWVGCRDESGKLSEVQKIVEDEMEKLGFERERKEFCPHVTLGRVKKMRNIEMLIKEIESIKSFELNFGVGQVSEILIMKSDLKPTGSVYTVLKRVSFTKNY